MRLFLYIVLLFLLGAPHTLTGQLSGLKTYTIREGLAGNWVKIIFQDSKGFIWIGTWEGLSKYDGHRFTNYTKANGLVSNLINDIYETPDGKIFIALNNGSTQVLNKEKVERGEVIKNLTINRFLPAGKAGLLMFTDQKGVQQCQLPALQPASYAIQSPHSLFVPVLDSLLLVTVVDGNSLKLYNSRLVELKTIPTKSIINQLLLDSHNRIWAASSIGLRQVFVDTTTQNIQLGLPPVSFQNHHLLNESILCMLEDDKGDFWIGTRTGLVLVEKNGGIKKFTRADGLPGDHVYCIFQDREKNLWVGTPQGVARIANQGKLKYWTSRNGLLDDYVSIILKTEKDFLLSNGAGIQRFNLSSGQFMTLTSSQPGLSWIQGNKSSVFAFSPFGRIGSINLEHNRILDSTNYRISKEININCAVTSNKGTFVIGTGTGELVIMRNKRLRVEKTPVSFITSLVFDDDCLWIGSYQEGLYKVCIKEADTLFLGEYSRISAMPDSMIRSVFVDSQKDVWVGTRHNGVYHLRREGDGTYRFEQFDQRRGLLSDWIRVIREDKHQNIWLGSSLGVDKLIPGKNGRRILSFSRFNNLFGVVNDIFPCDDNSILVAMNNGLANASDLRYDTIPPLPVYITRIQTRSKKDSSFIPAEHSTISLPYSKNSISFDFSSPGFINEKEIKYSYRLISGGDTSWSIPALQETVTFASLQAGSYRFEVRSLGWNGEWGAPTYYSFTVRPPFWKTGWFILSIAALFIFLLYQFYRYRIRQLKLLHQVRNRIATDLHDDIGSTLTNISILTELSKRYKDRPDKAELYLNRIQDEIDASGQGLDDIIWSVNSKNDSFRETAARMRRYAAEIFDARNIRYELTMDPQIADKKFRMEQRRDFFLVYKEALNNILKHAGATEVNISLYLKSNNIQLSIKDNGKGFDISRQTHRNGVANMKERVKRWKGSLEIDSGIGEGTAISLTLPLATLTQKRD